MSELVRPMAEWAAASVEALGIGVICAMTFYTLPYAMFRLMKGDTIDELYQASRLRLGRGILLGLELLVAADIVHTVAVELTFSTVGVLAIVVAIRTFLSFALEVELTGRWPWHGKTPRS